MNSPLSNPPVVSTELPCHIEDLLDSNLIDLITLAPGNPIVRELVFRQTQRTLPDECHTFDQIKAWLEAHCDKPQKSSSLCQGIAIAVEFSETEYGRADYTVQRSTRGQFDLEDADLRAMVQRAIQAGKALDEVIEHIAEQIHDYAWLQCNPQFEDYGPFNYNAHESTDSGNTKLNFSMTEIKDQLLIYLRERHPEFLGNL